MDIEIPEPVLTVSSFLKPGTDGEWLVRIELWGEIVYEKSVHEAGGYAWPVVEGKVKKEFARKLRELLEKTDDEETP